MKLRLRRVWWPAARCFVWQLSDDVGSPVDTIQKFTFAEICEAAAIVWNNSLALGLASGRTEAVTLH